MNKENEDKDIIYASGYAYTSVRDRFRDVLKYNKESIDNANPSEALKNLEVINNYGCGINDNMKFSEVFEKEYNTIKQALIKSQEQEKVLNELIKLVKDLEPTFNRKDVSSDTDILGTIIKDYFYDNASELLKSVFEKNIQK